MRKGFIKRSFSWATADNSPSRGYEGHLPQIGVERKSKRVNSGVKKTWSIYLSGRKATIMILWAWFVKTSTLGFFSPYWRFWTNKRRSNTPKMMAPALPHSPVIPLLPPALSLPSLPPLTALQLKNFLKQISSDVKTST